MSHYSLKSGSAEGITKGLFEYAEESKIDMNEIIVIGCDGTAINTGEKRETIRLIKMKLNRLVHHFICQLHANELPLRHLVENLDGKTFGPRGFTGPIDKQLQNCENNPIVIFERIHAELPTVGYQRCLYRPEVLI